MNLEKLKIKDKSLKILVGNSNDKVVFRMYRS
jgi:hypothetical protein